MSVGGSNSFVVSTVGIELSEFSVFLSSPLLVAVFGLSAGLLASGAVATVSPDLFATSVVTVVLFGVFAVAVSSVFSAFEIAELLSVPTCVSLSPDPATADAVADFSGSDFVLVSEPALTCVSRFSEVATAGAVAVTVFPFRILYLFQNLHQLRELVVLLLM